MWGVLRAEFAYFRPFLAFAWAIAVGVAVLINGLILVVGDEGHPGSTVAIGLPGIFLVIAALVVGFIAQGTRSEERRARLLLTTPLTPRQLGAAMVLLPACLIGLGALAAGLLLTVSALVSGRIEPTPVRMVVGVASQMFAIVQMGPLAQESTASRRQGRRTAAILGWTGFVVAILLLAGMQANETIAFGAPGQLAIAVAAMVGSAALYAGRTDFTR